MTRIVFTADLHIDEYGTRRHPRSGLNLRLLDYLATTRLVAEGARDAEAAALVVAGDFTERKHVNDWLLRHIQDALSDGPKRQVFLRGNHDAEIAGESKVSVLAEMGAGWSSHSIPGHAVVGDVVLCLMPYLDRHWLRTQPGMETVPDADVFRALAEQHVAIARGLFAQAKRAHPDKATVLVCHQTLAGGRMSEAQQAFLGDLSLVVDTQALAAIGFEGIVAGHLHRHQVIPAPVPVLYTGSIERVDFGEQDETKGYVVADIEPGRFDWSFVETPARRFVTITGEELAAAPMDALERARDAVVRVRGLLPEVDPADCRKTLEKAGAFEVHSIERLRVYQPAATSGLAESLTPMQAVEAFFAEDPDRDALTERARELIGAAS
jgi:DNA repair protein SbcD/Mre11